MKIYIEGIKNYCYFVYRINYIKSKAINYWKEIIELYITKIKDDLI